MVINIEHTSMVCLLKKGAKGAESMMHNGEITTMTAFIEVFLAKVLERFATKQGKFESDISEGLFKTASPHEEINEELLEELEIHEDIPVYNDLPLDALPSGEITTMFVSLIQNELSRTIDVPVLVAKGKIEGPVLGVTSTLHGNEVNGIPVISKLFREIDVESLRGTLVGVPVLNPPGFSRRQRAFLDGRDLNRIFPGKPAGTSSQTYCHMILEKFAKKFDYHLDLHTAGLGRVNSLYVRADMNNPITHQMAVLQQSQIILHNTAPDGSLRIASMALGIPSITVEIGNPLQIHQEFVECALSGVRATLDWLNMLPIYPSEKIEETSSRAKTTTCTRSYWVYAEHGGMLQVMPKINTWVSKGDVVAVVRDVFGNILVKYKAKEDSIVIGKSVNPICCAGERVVHLGVCDDEFGKKK
uniref:Succinylglutamate desuccinylase/Aspartoacylase catalytic domain-containing protein n=1 Tax=Aplanochytrium stocchinoi TaxID=215587 RepID=A0A7S3PNS5_9STRA|mmetsp:Transcript_6736/g.7720  ORF Transcript_6736/g.7720 Transcript_6736/m.7720 type:complete len:416 (-) Transcript_6736:1517-2764(-)